MLIHNGDAGLFDQAAAMIERDPHPAHLLEHYACTGKNEPIGDLIRQAVSLSEIGCALVHKDAALVCGVATGGPARMVWMTTTRCAGRYPKWLMRGMTGILRDAARYFDGRVETFFQVIPLGYAEGLNFVRHLGFSFGELRHNPATGHYFHTVEMRVKG